MRLLLARHGESVWNATRTIQGVTDVALSDLGRAQAQALGRALRRYRLAAAYVSPLARAHETAEIALAEAGVPLVDPEGGFAPLPEPPPMPVPGLRGRRPRPTRVVNPRGDASPGVRGIPLVTVEELRELSLGAWEGVTVEALRARNGDPFQAWLRTPHDAPPPGAEPLDAVLARVRRALDRIAAAHGDGEDVLVLTHGGVISVYACHLLGCSFNALWRLRLDNASLTVVRPPRLVTINDTAHLAAALRGPHLQRLEPAAGRDALTAATEPTTP